MKRLAAGLLLLAALPLCGRVVPQFGVESFLGGRYRLFSLAPWAGLRIPLASTASLIVKYRRQSIAFDYLNEDGGKERQRSSLNMLTGVYYRQQGRLDAYAALFQMFGSGGYNASGADIGCAYRLWRPLAVETGLYLLNEKSTLWYPDEAVRRISLFVWHAGVKLALAANLELNPQLHFGGNSESVSTFAWSAGLNFTPRDPLTITITYMRYSETDETRFSGDYLSGGVNFYF